jgi:hypothetical protein
MKAIPCPQCGGAPFMVGPDGGRQRRCWTCNFIWTPRAIDEAGARWGHRPRKASLEELAEQARESTG